MIILKVCLVIVKELMIPLKVCLCLVIVKELKITLKVCLVIEGEGAAKELKITLKVCLVIEETDCQRAHDYVEGLSSCR